MSTITWRTLVWFPAVLAAGSAEGCIAHIGDPAGDAPIVCDGSAIYPGDAPVRRMTRFEYNNSVRDLLGDTTAPASSFPADEVSGVFNNQASALVVTELLAEGYMKASESIATVAVQNVNSLTGCDPQAAGPTACGDKFIESFGKRAFRRPLDSDSKAMLTSVFTQALAQWDYPTA